MIGDPVQCMGSPSAPGGSFMADGRLVGFIRSGLRIDGNSRLLEDGTQQDRRVRRGVRLWRCRLVGFIRPRLRIVR